MTAVRRFARCLATSGPVRRLATAGPARRPATAGRALLLQPSARPRAGDMSSRGFSTWVDSETYEKYYKIVRGALAVIGLLTTAGGALGAGGYYVINSVNRGVDEKLQVHRDATAAKMEAERVRSEDFWTLETKTHLDTVRKIDEVISDLRAQFNNLSVRFLESKYLEAFYSSQIQKAQEVLDCEGATTSSEVHLQLLPKINDLESQVALLTEEVTKLRLITKNSGAAPAVPAEDAESIGQTREGSHLKMSDAVISKDADSVGLTKEPSQKISGAVSSEDADSIALSKESSQKKSKTNVGGGPGSL